MNNEEIIEYQIREKQNSIRYDLRSYSIDMIVEKFRFEDFFIPRYQRGFVWNKKTQSLFIESIIMGLPTSLLFTVETNDGRLEIIDGVQRIKTIEAYTNNDLVLSGLDEIPLLNDTRFQDLSFSQQRKFLHRSMNLIILSSDTSLDSRLEIYKRMNLGGSKKSPHQLRMTLMDGQFIDFVKQLAEHPLFNEIIQVSPFMRMRDEREDLIIRFFALSDNLNAYRNNMSSFLNSYVERNNNQFDSQRLAYEFDTTLHFIFKYLREVFYQRNRRMNSSLFQAIFVGVNLALRDNPNLIPSRIGWIHETDLIMRTRSHALQSSKRIKDGIFFVMDNLLNS